MEKVWEGRSVTLTDLERVIGRIGVGLFVIATDEGIVAFCSNGRIVKSLMTSDSRLGKVKIYRTDKLEFLGYLERPERWSPPDEVIPEQRQRRSVEVPKTVRFSYSIEAPSSVYVSVEKAITKFALEARQRMNVTIETVELKCTIVVGFTGRDILRVEARLKGYSLGKPSPDDLGTLLARMISKETGFNTRVSVTEVYFTEVERLPLLRIGNTSVDFKGGKIMEIKLKRQETPMGVMRRQMEREVDELIRRSGLDELARVLKKRSSTPQISVKRVGSYIHQSLMNIKGMNVNWVNLSPSHDGAYTVSVGLERNSGDLSNVDIMEIVKEHVKVAEQECRVMGEPVSFDKVIVVIEKDIY